MEQPRPGVDAEGKGPSGEDLRDGLRWYCQDCREIVAERRFVCTDLGSQIKEAVQAFEADREARTCRNCGSLCDMVPNGGDVEKLRPRDDE